MRKTKMAMVGIGSAVLLATGGAMTAGAAPSGGNTDARPTLTDPAPAQHTAKSTMADAKAKRWKCDEGAVCFYPKTHGKGKPRQVHANTNKDSYGRNSARSRADTGHRLDHALVKWHWSGSSKDRWGCLSPGERWEKTPSFTMDAVRWRSSCKL